MQAFWISRRFYFHFLLESEGLLYLKWRIFLSNGQSLHIHLFCSCISYSDSWILYLTMCIYACGARKLPKPACLASIVQHAYFPLLFRDTLYSVNILLRYTSATKKCEVSSSCYAWFVRTPYLHHHAVCMFLWINIAYVWFVSSALACSELFSFLAYIPVQHISAASPQIYMYFYAHTYTHMHGHTQTPTHIHTQTPR